MSAVPAGKTVTLVCRAKNSISGELYARTFESGAIGYTLEDLRCLRRVAAYREADFDRTLPRAEDIDAAVKAAAAAAAEHAASAPGGDAASSESKKRSSKKKRKAAEKQAPHYV